MMNRKFKLLQCVALAKDLPQHGLKAGAVGTIVHEFSTPQEAYAVEFADADGKTVAMVNLEPEKLIAANFG